jgi:hypothetical protein
MGKSGQEQFDPTILIFINVHSCAGRQITIAPSRVDVFTASGIENGSREEVIMLRVRQICAMAVLSSAVLVLSSTGDASAQKKLSYEDAYAKCKAQLDRTFPSGSTSTSGRNTAGAACMKQMGFNLKKGVDF